MIVIAEDGAVVNLANFDVVKIEEETISNSYRIVAYKCDKQDTCVILKSNIVGRKFAESDLQSLTLAWGRDKDGLYGICEHRYID